jgi:hypothetical protein
MSLTAPPVALRGQSEIGHGMLSGNGLLVVGSREKQKHDFDHLFLANGTLRPLLVGCDESCNRAAGKPPPFDPCI